MAEFAFKTTVSALVPSGTGALMDFSLGVGDVQTVQDVWLCNNSGTKQTVNLYFDYDGTSATTTEQFMKDFPVPADQIIHITGLWVFENGGRISGDCSTNNAVTIHISKADG